EGQKWGPGLDLPHSIFNRLVNPDANWRGSEHEYAGSIRAPLRASAADRADSPEPRQVPTVLSPRPGPGPFPRIEAAKVRLSELEATEIRYEAEGVRIVEPLARAELWELFRDEFAAIRALIDQTLAAGGRRAAEVDRVLLAGGSSALVCAQELLRE